MPPGYSPGYVACILRRVTSSAVIWSLASGLLASTAGCSAPASASCEHDFNLGFVRLDTADDIAALPRVQTIVELAIVDSELEDLTGLECLTTVSKLRIDGNTRLRSLDGLDNLTRVVRIGEDEPLGSWNLVIEDNPVLESLAGLAALEEVENSLSISRNEVLVTVDELASLQTVGFTLRIDSNPALERIELTNYRGWPAQNDFGGGLAISGNALLHTVELARVVDVQSLKISSNAALGSLELRLEEHPRMYHVIDNPLLTRLPAAGPGVSGFNAFQSHVISKNDALTSLAGLTGLDGVEELVIEDNPRLTDLHGLEQLSVALSISILGNERLASLAALDPGRAGALELADELKIEGNGRLRDREAAALASALHELNPALVADVDGNDAAGVCR